MTNFNYKQARQDLDKILEWFEDPNIDFEEADAKYQEAKKIISDIEKYLSKKEAELKVEIKK
jgi:exodeoxyribonuclease VII small subunit